MQPRDFSSSSMEQTPSAESDITGIIEILENNDRDEQSLLAILDEQLENKAEEFKANTYYSVGHHFKYHNNLDSFQGNCFENAMTAFSNAALAVLKENDLEKYISLNIKRISCDQAATKYSMDEFNLDIYRKMDDELDSLLAQIQPENREKSAEYILDEVSIFISEDISRYTIPFIEAAFRLSESENQKKNCVVIFYEVMRELYEIGLGIGNGDEFDVAYARLHLLLKEFPADQWRCEIYLKVATLYLEWRDYENAEKVLLLCLEHEKPHYAVYFRLLWTQFNQNKPEESLINTVVSLAHKLPSNYSLEMVQVLDTVMLQPDDFLRIPDSLLKNKKYHEAEKITQKLISLLPETADRCCIEAYTRLGRAISLQKDGEKFDKASEAFLKAYSVVTGSHIEYPLCPVHWVLGEYHAHLDTMPNHATKLTLITLIRDPQQHRNLSDIVNEYEKFYYKCWEMLRSNCNTLDIQFFKLTCDYLDKLFTNDNESCKKLFALNDTREKFIRLHKKLKEKSVPQKLVGLIINDPSLAIELMSDLQGQINTQKEEMQFLKNQIQQMSEEKNKKANTVSNKRSFPDEHPVTLENHVSFFQVPESGEVNSKKPKFSVPRKFAG